MIHYLVAAIFDLMIGALSILLRKDKATKSFSLTAFCIAAWSFELFLLTWMKNVELLSLYFHVLRVGMFLIAPFLALTTWMLLGHKSKKFLHIVIYPAFVIGIGVGLYNLFIAPSVLKPVANGYLPIPDLAFYVFAFNFIWCFIGSIVYAAYTYRVSTQREKLKIKWLLITLVLTLVSSVMAMYFMTFDFYLSKSIGVVPNMVFVGFLAYATLQYNLMDFRTALSFGIAKVLSLVFFSLIFVSLLSILKTESQAGTTVLAVVLFAIFLEAYPKLIGWLKSKTNRLFSACPYDPEVLKQELSPRFLNCNSAPELKGVLDYFFHHVLKVNSYQLYHVRASQTPGAVELAQLDNAGLSLPFGSTENIAALVARSHPITMIDEATGELQTTLAKNNAISCFPIVVNQEVAALMFVGRPQNDANFYRFEDFKLLEWLMVQLAATLERIEKLNSMEQELGEAKKRLSLLSLMNDYHHDIKAPLSIIDGVVSNELYDDQKRKEIILEQVAWGSELIAAMARLLKGNRSRKVELLDLNDVVSECCEIFSKTRTNIQLSLTTSMMIEGDKDDLKILVINTLKNAIEAARVQIPLVIDVATSNVNGRVCLKITDNGQGMTSESLCALWTDNFGSTKKNGSGIGLQAIKRIADEHMALVDVSSRVGEGSIFTFSFAAINQS